MSPYNIGNIITFEEYEYAGYKQPMICYFLSGMICSLCWYNQHLIKVRLNPFCQMKMKIWVNDLSVFSCCGISTKHHCDLKTGRKDSLQGNATISAMNE